MNNKKELINKLDTVARNIAEEIVWKGDVFSKEFLGWDNYNRDEDWYKIDILDDGGLRYFRDPHTYIEFKDIRPSGKFETTMHDPVLLEEKITDLNTVEVLNDSDVEVDRTYKYTETEETTSQQDVGVEFGVSIRQMFSYGGEAYGFGGETEIAANINTSYNQSTGVGNTSERENTTNIKVPPKTKMRITSKRSVSKFRQKVTVDAEIDWSLRIVSGDAYYEFEEKEEIVDILSGYGKASHPLVHKMREIGGNPFNEWDVEHWNPDISTSFDKETRFDAASSGSISVSSEPVE